MDSVIRHLFKYNRAQKLLSIALSALIWVFVYQSIKTTKTLSFVPIRITNLPADRTIQGLQPNGFLHQRISLTLTGTKYVINRLEPGDVEVLLDASNKPKEWIVSITKKNLVSLNPTIDMSRHITSVEYPELILRLSPFITEQIPVQILPPIGKAPPGYQFIAVWPQELSQTVSGPEEEVLILKNRRLELSFDLNEITKKQLDALSSSKKGLMDDEVSFPVPDSWKRVIIPFLNNASEQLNDPKAKELQIDFLRKEAHPIEEKIPLNLYFPLENSATKNPANLSLAITPLIQQKNRIFFLDKNLYAKNVSKLFLHIVQNNLQLSILVEPKTDFQDLNWSLQVINWRHLESAYLAYIYTFSSEPQEGNHPFPLEWENHLRNRFQYYLRNLVLFEEPDKRLELNSYYQNGEVVVNLGEKGG